MKCTNICLIGMPDAGKSTVGVLLAKAISWAFLDTDVLIQAADKRCRIFINSGSRSTKSMPTSPSTAPAEVTSKWCKRSSRG